MPSPTPSKTLLLSIKPRYVEKILAGEKTVELRRTRPRIVAGERFLIYTTVPVKQLTAVAWAGGVVSGSPKLIWQRFASVAGVSRAEFDAYFAGVGEAFGIKISSVDTLQRALSLDELRVLLPGFHPPQVFRYLCPVELGRLGISSRRRAA